MTRPLRIGLLNDSTYLTADIHDLVAWAAERDDVEVSHVIVHAPPARGPVARFIGVARRDGLYFALSKVVFQAVTLLERWLLRAAGVAPPSAALRDVSALVPGRVELTPVLSKSGHVYRFSDDDLARVRVLELDLLIRCGSGILRGDILHAARLGVVSMHHADNRVNRGGPPAFWEVYQRDDTTGFTIQRLTEELDGGVALMRGRFATRYAWQLNHAELVERAGLHLQRLVAATAARGALPDGLPDAPYAGRLYRTPYAHQALAYIARLGTTVAVKAARRALRRQYRWRVAFTRRHWTGAVLSRGIVIENPPGRFLADPFVVRADDRDFCFVEDYDYAAGRAKIAVYELDERSAHRVGTALQEPFHLSFPFLFEYGGERYMCPESLAAGDIRVYRATGFPLQWEHAATLMTGVCAADTMLFEHADRWWMLTNFDPLHRGECSTELHLFSAPSPLAAEWTPHPCNPLSIDAAYARNGGLLEADGRLYRVAQGQGFDLYGKRLTLREVTELTPDSYAECEVAEIQPSFRPEILGVHHLHGNDAVTVFDFVDIARITRR